MKYLIWVIAEIALVFVLLSLPGSSFSDRTGWLHLLPIDKIVHVILFGSLAWAFYYFLDQTTIQALKSVRAKAWAMIFCIVYGITMEYYQKWYVPSRGFEVKDMIADAAGVLLALPLYQLWKKRQ
jgi:VanZ family protein